MLHSSGRLLMATEHRAIQDQAEGAYKSILWFLTQRGVPAQRHLQIQHTEALVRQLVTRTCRVLQPTLTPSTVRGNSDKPSRCQCIHVMRFMQRKSRGNWKKTWWNWLYWQDDSYDWTAKNHWLLPLKTNRVDSSLKTLLGFAVTGCWEAIWLQCASSIMGRKMPVLRALIKWEKA